MIIKVLSPFHFLFRFTTLYAKYAVHHSQCLVEGEIAIA